MTMRLRTPAHRRGAHAVEFAVALPVFLTFLWGLIEVGRGFMVAGLLGNAAQAGCRAGVLPSATTTSVEQAVDTYLGGIGVNGYTTQVQVSGVSGVSPGLAGAGA